MQPLKPVPPGARLALGAGFFAVFLGAWAFVTYGGHVPALFLASPGRTLAAGWSLLTGNGFLRGNAGTGVPGVRGLPGRLGGPGVPRRGRFPDRRGQGGAAGPADGRLQAGRGLLRAVLPLLP